MSLSPQWLDELRARVSLSQVVGRTTRLTRAGREFKACCPFHDEKTPSFTLNDAKGFYHCFGCGAHGDVIRWMTDQRGLSFIDAVKELAAEAGMDLPEPDPRAARAAERRDTLHDVVAAAQAWFVGNLAGFGGAAARAYLAARGLSAEVVARYGFGWAPDDRQALKAALSRFPDALLVEAGLRIVVEDKEPYDRFRGRITLPIHDARGRAIAFGGRVLAEREGAPKYLNSPDTPLFDKGATLFNLHRAATAARGSGRLVVVEGYMDVVALGAAGLAACVAPLGTALTERQLQLAWRHADTPVLCFDGDAAGQRAAMRAIARALPLLEPARSLRIARLPTGIDPDDLVRTRGVAALEALLAEAATLLDALWSHERDAEPLPTPEAKAGLKARLLAHVDTIAHADIRALYRRELLDRFSDHAFPPRPVRSPAVAGPGAWPAGRRSTDRAAPRPSGEAVARLRRIGEGGTQRALAAAVIAGLVRWPAEIGRHCAALAGEAAADPRFAALLEALDGCIPGEPLESACVRTIFDRRGLAVPDESSYAGLRLGFLVDGAAAPVAAAELSQAVALLVDRPALDAALRRATRRFEREMSDEAYAEQQRLLRRRLEFDVRLRQMSGALAEQDRAEQQVAARNDTE